MMPEWMGYILIGVLAWLLGYVVGRDRGFAKGLRQGLAIGKGEEL